jgi:phosphohistidine phosphatase SixA
VTTPLIAPRLFLATSVLAPELMLSSDAVRAHLTAAAMADATGGHLLLDGRLYHAAAGMMT